MKRFLFFIMTCCALSIYAYDPCFVVVIPSYNNAAFYKENLDSVMNQKYEQFEVLYVADCCTDNTDTYVLDYVKNHPRKDKITVICNPVRRGALANIYMAVHRIPDDKIVVMVDGDDWLDNDMVLERIACEYRNPDVWLTYGQMRNLPLCREIEDYVYRNKSFRETAWVTSHPKTFYAGLFKRIKKEDLIDYRTGNFYSMTSDLAFMFPMLEMCSRKNIRFIPDSLYVYNMGNPLSDGRIDPTFQHQLEHEIRTKKKYAQLRLASWLSSSEKQELSAN